MRWSSIMRAEPRTDPSGTVDTIEYRRVSTLSQAADDRTSLADQGSANAKFAAALERQIGRTFEDAGISGKTADRPAFLRMVSYCEEHPRPKRDRGIVLALNATRFGRFDAVEASFWQHKLRKVGWDVRFAEGDDIEHPTGRALMRSFNASQAHEYSVALSTNSKRGKRSSVERGYWVSKAPYGYRRQVVVPSERTRILETGVPKTKDERLKLAIGPAHEARIVKWMFSAYDSGRHSIATITRKLNDLEKSLRWSRTYVHHILANPAYIGDIVGGRVRHDIDADDYVWRSDESDWYVTKEAHPALVSRELFERVKNRLAANRRQPKSPDSAYALSGLVRCATCDEPYVGGGGGRNPNNPAEPYRFYKDRGGNEPMRGDDTKKCAGRIGTVSRHILEGAVVRAIAEEVAKPELQAKIEEELDRLIEAADNNPVNDGRDLKMERRKLDRSLSNLLDAVEEGTFTKQEVATRVSRLRNDLASISAEDERARFARKSQNRLREERERILALANGFTECVQGLSGAVRRALVAPWIQRATFDKNTRELSLTMRLVPLTDSLLLSSCQDSNLR
jgi:site-specific DNA recombinase